MGFWNLLEVASFPILQVLLISGLGALLATNRFNLLTSDARKSLNKLVFMVFTPCLTFANLAKTVTLQDIISWWFMPVNIGITFFVGGVLGWMVVKILKPKPHLEGLIIAMCSAGNLGNLLLIIVPAICNENGSPFGNRETCRSIGLSYASFSMALGSLYIWTYTYHLIRTSAAKFHAIEAEDNVSKAPNNDLEATPETCLLNGDDQEHVAISLPPTKSIDDQENQAVACQEPYIGHGKMGTLWTKLVGLIQQIVEELLAPPTVAAIVGLIFGAISFLKNLIIGNDAPLRVFQDSIKLLGDATIPSLTLILGGNLIQGLRSSTIKPLIIIGVVVVRFVALPAIGMWLVKAAASVGFLPDDPLYHFVLMVQYTLPPAMTISTMTQLYDVAREECAVLFLWTYLVAAFALTFWSTIYMWTLS